MRTLSNFDIDNMFKGRKQYLGCYARNAIPRSIWQKRGFMVINQDNAHGPGTHWVYLRLGPTNAYVDSFGMAPAEEVVRGLKSTGRKCHFSNIQIQDKNSNSCGWFATMLGFENCIKNRPLEDILCDDMGYNPKMCEYQLTKYFAQKGLH